MRTIIIAIILITGLIISCVGWYNYIEKSPKILFFAAAVEYVAERWFSTWGQSPTKGSQDSFERSRKRLITIFLSHNITFLSHTDIDDMGQDIWRRHLGIWQTLADIFHHFLTLIWVNQEIIQQYFTQYVENKDIKHWIICFCGENKFVCL